ncbi:MAG: molybdopterin-dependent oxidoreductase [Anaerolineales bacterium]|nr:molybdopterin-dependent oxidoreductase [Anaerolineales bacterium]
MKNITLTINGHSRDISVNPEEKLRDVLRKLSYFSVKHGCEDGNCGACTVIIDGKAVKSCRMKAVDAVGKQINTLEGLSAEGQTHPLQQAFMETGAIQCGYCTPAQIMTAKALLDRNPSPNEEEIRQAMNGVICRCTGYVRTVEAVQRAAAELRGETVLFPSPIELTLPEDSNHVRLPEDYYRNNGWNSPLPPLVFTPEGYPKKRVVGKPEIKVDAEKLARGKPVFTDDVHMEEMLYGALLTSPHAHAKIKRIDTEKARALPGVHAVLTYQDIPRIKHASGGQSYKQPLPYDQVCLDNKVRHEGDRVAVVAAETPEIAEQALGLIDVDYVILPHVLDPIEAMQEGAPVIHDEEDTQGIYQRERNIVQHIEAEVGDVEKAFAEADMVYTGEYHTPRQQHAHIEPHVCITYWDEDQRLVIRTSTQVPFHIRRMVAPLVDLPVKRIRVIKPRIGGGFGNKQEMLLEDLCAHLTVITGRPVRMEFTRVQEFTSSRSRHPEIMQYKVAVKNSQVTGAELYLVGNTGAYGTHSLTVNMVGGFKGLTLYNAPNSRFRCDVVYTNTPPSGAFRGYGAMQCEYGIEVCMAEIAEKMGMDEVEFKRRNWIKQGESMYLSRALGEGREGTEQALQSTALDQCVNIGLQATDFYNKRKAYQSQTGNLRKGIGMAVVIHGSAIAGLDMASASIKINDDGSFNLLIGATDLGTGSDTVLAQIAAEELGVPLEDIIVYSSDTDFTPFDKGAYASSTTYLSGEAVRKAAAKVAMQIREHAALMLNFSDLELLELRDRKVHTPQGESVSLAEVALSSLHQLNQHQIMATASHTSQVSPPPTAAQFAEITLDMQSGKIQVDRLLMLVDCGRVINPITAAGQVEGGMAQGLGFALTEEMLFDNEGHQTTTSLATYHVPRCHEMPIMDVIFVQTDEPSGPFGAKSVSEIAIDGVAPAIASAIHNAAGVWMHQLPYTPGKVLKALKESA